MSLDPSDYRSVLAELQNVLPHGTQPRISADNDLPAEPIWDVLPALPTDVFGAVAHLLRVSGVMGWFEPAPECDDPASSVHITMDERALLKDWAFNWRTGDDAGPIQDLWTKLVTSHGSDCLRPRLLSQNRQGSLEWCRVALKLLVVADLAAEGLARPLPQEEESANVMRDLLKAKNKPDRDGDTELTIAGSALKRRHRHPASMTTQIDTDVACVLPKSRVAQVGYTLRSLSANLALLPPRASVRCQWAEPVAQLRDDDRATLDILLIPAPFEINGVDFEERPSRSGS